MSSSVDLVTDPGMLPVVDADSHLAEPPDLWTARLSERKWGDAIPRVVHDERHDMDRWLIGGRKLTGVSNYATAGWPEYPPSYPKTMAEADPGAFRATERLQRMDEYGVTVQALYPNLLAFSAASFRKLDPQLALECVRVYNDYLVEFAEEAPERFILLTVLPIWDVDECVREVVRCRDNGHHGVVFIAKPHKAGLPELRDPHWEPLFETINEMGGSINFHVGFADFTEEDFKAQLSAKAERHDYAKLSSLQMLNNAEAIAEIITAGICHRYPFIEFVSVESGFGWLPSFIECLDWQWRSSGSAQAYPERELPSFYFRRQVNGMFWFETEAVRRILDIYPDNVMFETDYPHPTSLSPGPASAAKIPRDMVRDAFEGVPLELTRKALYENAARIYNLDVDRLAGGNATRHGQDPWES